MESNYFHFINTQHCNCIYLFRYSLSIHLYLTCVCLALVWGQTNQIIYIKFFFFFEFYKLETNSLVKMDKLYASKRIFQWKNWVKLYMHIFDNQRYHITEVLNWIISSSIMYLPLILQSIIIGNQMDELQLEEV